MEMFILIVSVNAINCSPSSTLLPRSYHSPRLQSEGLPVEQGDRNSERLCQDCSFLSISFVVCGGYFTMVVRR